MYRNPSWKCPHCNIYTSQGLEEKLKHVEAEKSSLASNLEEMRNTSVDSNSQIEKMATEVKEKSTEISGLQGKHTMVLQNDYRGLRL